MVAGRYPIAYGNGLNNLVNLYIDKVYTNKHILNKNNVFITHPII